MRLKSAAILALALVIAGPAPRAQRPAHPALAASDIDAIATLLKLEDTRQLDEAALGRLLKASHPEVRRRAALAVGRIAPKALPAAPDSAERGRALLEPLHAEKDTELLATVVFSTGQLKTAESIPWLASLLSSPSISATIAQEAACALGKFKNADAASTTPASTAAQAALAVFLAQAPANAPPSVVGEALLSIGRFAGRYDLAPVVRWSTTKDAEVRWRAAWALFRPRNPDAVQTLIKMTSDASPDVRFWAARGLAPALADETHLDRAVMSARLRELTKDDDRRVRTEAIRALVAYDDDASFEMVMNALDSPDTWISVSAAESLGGLTARASIVVPRLVAATVPSRPLALRLASLAPLTTLAPAAAADLAASLVHESNAYARTTAIQSLQRLGDAGKAKLDALAADPATKYLVPAPGAGRGSGGRGAGGGAARPAPMPLSDAEYRALVTTWIVPDYNGTPKPHAVWETPKGAIEIELYPGDAPMGTAYFVKSIESGDIVGTLFTRVVPNFVDQQATIKNAPTLRDEVSRRGLTRANLAWASAGLDTGRPGFTLGVAPQPHNEGDFTALGRVVKGLDAMDRIELGDGIISARMIK